MSSTSEPDHLSNHHRNTLRQIFEHPVSHNVEWRAVVSLLDAVGSVVQHHDGKVAVTVGSQAAFFDPPADKDIDTQAVVDLRRMLSAAGYSPASKHVLLWLMADMEAIHTFEGTETMQTLIVGRAITGIGAFT
jgi:hypothetical protein